MNVQTASSVFDLDLNLGSYKCEYSRNGSKLLLHSTMGHASIINWRDKSLDLEIKLQ